MTVITIQKTRTVRKHPNTMIMNIVEVNVIVTKTSLMMNPKFRRYLMQLIRKIFMDV